METSELEIRRNIQLERNSTGSEERICKCHLEVVFVAIGNEFGFNEEDCFSIRQFIWNLRSHIQSPRSVISEWMEKGVLDISNKNLSGQAIMEYLRRDPCLPEGIQYQSCLDKVDRYFRPFEVFK